MSYIPPHLRASNSGRGPSPEAPSLSPRAPNVYGRRSRELVPDVTIKKSSHFTSRLIVFCCHHVKFAKFEGETFAHLPQHQLYILEAATADNAISGQEISELNLQESPAKLIVGVLQEDLKAVLEKFKEFVSVENAGRVVPLMWLKFGKAIFHSRSGPVELHRSFTPKEAEMMRGGGRDLSTTFDNSVSKEIFSLLWNFARRNALQSWSKETFTVQVSDKARPETHLWCVCTCSKGDEQTSLASGKSAESALHISKVKLSPIRYMISDVACVGKSNDIRLMFFVKNYLTVLSEEESQDLESCISRASVDQTAKGGLRWPLGSKQSTSGRFRVVGSVHQTKTFVLGSGLRWLLKECNRIEYKASSGRISYEVSVRPIIYHEFCKALEERTVEELIASVADMLQQVWEECVET